MTDTKNTNETNKELEELLNPKVNPYDEFRAVIRDRNETASALREAEERGADFLTSEERENLRNLAQVAQTDSILELSLLMPGLWKDLPTPVSKIEATLAKRLEGKDLDLEGTLKIAGFDDDEETE